jgi:hypothetical protein
MHFQYGHKFLESPAAIEAAYAKHRTWLFVPTPKGTHLFECLNEAQAWRRLRLKKAAARRANAEAKAERAKWTAIQMIVYFRKQASREAITERQLREQGLHQKAKLANAQATTWSMAANMLAEHMTEKK